MKVGVLGSGEVAKTLGSGFLKHGHQVMLGIENAREAGGVGREADGNRQDRKLC